MKGVQCYELFGGIALKIHTFSFFHFHIHPKVKTCNGSATFVKKQSKTIYSHIGAKLDLLLKMMPKINDIEDFEV